MSKNKLNIDSLSRLSFVKMVAERFAAVSKTPDAPVKDLMAYLPNQLAAALHPHVQFLKVKEVITHNDDFKSFILTNDAAMGTKSLAWFSAGQYLAVAVEKDEKVYTRPYSIASSPRDSLKNEYRIAVKRVPGGIVSQTILDTWDVGTAVITSAPLGVFTYEPLRDAATVVGIAGGSGITPFFSLAKAIAEGDEDCSLVLLYGSRTLADAVFSDEIRALAETCPKIRLVNVLSEEENDTCEHGFITADLIKKYAPAGEDYSLFLCGPQAMYSFVDKEIEKLGIRRKFVRHELFGEYFHPEKNADYPLKASAEFEVTVHMGDKTEKIACASDTTLLRAMEAAGLNPPSDCRSGRCGWCHSQLLQGDVYIPAEVDGRRAADKQFGYIHPCCAFPLSNVEIDVPPMPV